MIDTHPIPLTRSDVPSSSGPVAGLGALFAAALGLPAVAYLIDPRNRPAPDSDFKTVARLGDLKPNDPSPAVVRNVRHDAWTLHPNDVIGRVWLIRRDGDKVEAFTTICPHLGCSINYEAKEQRFVCPCHNGQFDSHCKKLPLEMMPNNPAPRDMDELEVRLVPAPTKEMTKEERAQIEVQVKYVNYRQGEEQKIAKT